LPSAGLIVSFLILLGAPWCDFIAAILDGARTPRRSAIAFLRVELGRIRWEHMQYDIVRSLEIRALMIAGAVHEQQDELSAVLLGQCVEKTLEALRIRRRQDEIDASSVLRADGTI
jgi:hypothetical protein